MKHTKRLLAILIAALILAVSAAPALAADPYTVVNASTTLTGTGLGLNEEFSVTEVGGTNPAVTYTLKLGTIKAYNGYGDATKVENVAGVNGKTLGTVTFNAGTVLNGNPVTKNYDVPDEIVNAIKALRFDRPGIYYWEITKEITAADAVKSVLTNHNRASISNNGTALVIRVNDVEGVLTPSISINVFADAEKTTLGEKSASYKDNYPATPGTLTLKKAVTGNQGEQDRYFKFTVTLSELDAFNGVKLTPTAANSVKTATAKYGEAITGADNLKEVTIENGKATFTFWLSDQEQIQIPNIPGVGTTKYTITESENSGYDVTYAIEAGGAKIDGDGSTIEERVLNGDRVVFENDRNTSIPTGITLQMAAPLFGIVLVGLLMAVVLFSKRRENY